EGLWQRRNDNGDHADVGSNGSQGGLLVGTGHQRRTWLQRYHDSLSIAARLPYDPVAGRQRWQIAALKAAKYLPCGLCCRTFYFQLLAVVADHQAGLFRSQVLAVDVVAA